MDATTLTGSLTTFCGESECVYHGQPICSNDFVGIALPSSCAIHAAIIFIDVVLLSIYLFDAICKASSRPIERRPLFQRSSLFQMISAIFNGALGLAYLLLGICILEERLRKGKGAIPMHHWLVNLFHGLTWVLLGLISSLKAGGFSKILVRSWPIIAFLSAVCLCFTSILPIFRDRETFSVQVILDILSLPGAMLLFCAVKCSEHSEAVYSVTDALYKPLNAEIESVTDCRVTPFACAGFLSRLLFFWLNPLMKRGWEKPLDEDDIPHLRKSDQAESCYELFLEKLNSQKRRKESGSPSIFWAIVSCQQREILVSGFFAVLKILTISLGPVLLNSFIKVAEGNASFKYEGYLLAGGLFVAKFVESLSQRQWYFRTRIIGLQLRSLLSAAIYQKQLRLSNTARTMHSAGEIMNYVTVDAYRIGEFPYWFHLTWTTSLQLCIALAILFHTIGLATIAAFLVIVLTVICNAPLAKLQHEFQTKLMEAQDERLKSTTEALLSMKVLKLYAWDSHFKKVIESFRESEYKWLSAYQFRRAYNSLLFWSSPVLVSAATFGACYLLRVPLYPSNVFTFVATLRLVQDPVRTIPEVIGVVIQAKVAFSRILKFLEAPELQFRERRARLSGEVKQSVIINSASFSWEENLAKPTLRNINLEVQVGEKVAICGEVGSGKSTLLAAILGEVSNIEGTVQVFGKLAYVSQTAWIQTGTIQENILFGSPMDYQRYGEVLEKCSLLKDLEMLPFGDLTEIGERGVNLSGGQKQRIQLARAVYQDADIYLLDDPFSAVDAHTSTSLFKECIMGALSNKTVLLVTHQVDFLPNFNSILLMSDGEILHSAAFHQLLSTSKEFQELVDAHKETAGSETLSKVVSSKFHISLREINQISERKEYKNVKSILGDQLIKQEEKEIGDTGLKPYMQYLKQNKGYIYLTLAGLSHLIFVAGQISQNSWMAANIQNIHLGRLRLILIYLAIGFSSTFFLFFRSILVVILGLQSSKSLFSQLLDSLFHAPMSFFDSTPLGRILSRVSSDLSIVDLDVPFIFVFAISSSINTYSSLGVLSVVTWEVLLICIPMIYLAIRLQKYYFASSKELMRINGTTKSLVANHLAESISGVMPIRAFREEERFFHKNLELIDKNATPFFHNFAANEWLIQRLEIMCATVLSFSAFVMALLPAGTFKPGFIGMALSYGLSLNSSFVFSIQHQSMLANLIISVERLNQYLNIPTEAPEVIEGNRPTPGWPAVGKVELRDLKVRYRPNAPLVLRGITCTFEGGHKIGIVGRTGSGKTTLISALFRLVEPAGGKIVVDGVDISKLGLHDLRSHFGVIPQEPTLFHGTVRFNLDPLAQYTDQEIWEVLGKCQLREILQEKEAGLGSIVTEDGSNWSMGQRQLFCLGRALLRRSRILVLDEATASIDNATDAILQKTIREEFINCTVITVAHRVPTVMDCTMVLALSDGKLVEYDEPMKLMEKKGSLFGELVKEYWSNTTNSCVQAI